MPVRVGLTPTPAMVMRLSGMMAAATSRNAADEMSPGTVISRALSGSVGRSMWMVDPSTRMGARLRLDNLREESGEPVADLEVRYSELRAATFGGREIVTMIDELPVLAVAATQAHGRTVIRDAGELRVKETDRIATTVSELRKLGARVEPTDDGMIIDGPTRLLGALVESHGDHRLALAMAVAGLVAKGETTVYGAEVVDDSFPGFVGTVRALGGEVED